MRAYIITAQRRAWFNKETETRYLWSILGVASVLAVARPAAACPWCKSPFSPGTYTGQAQRLGNGVAYSWVVLDSKGKPASLGVTLTAEALNGLPDKPARGMADSESVLSFPKQAVKSGFNHVVINWNPKGHEPDGIYTVPHFDVHFYLTPSEERERITAVGLDLARCRKAVPTRFMAPGYIYAPGAETARMGGHWADVSSPEFHGELFTRTFIYGSYAGHVTFLEPMISKAFLESRPDAAVPIAAPPTVERSGYYPKQYAVRYDATRNEYTIELTNLTWRQADKPNLRTAGK